MYYEHFGLSQAPYRITPDTELFYRGGERGAILNALEFAVVGGEALIKVVGEVGSGKTMLCRMLGQQLPEHVETVFIANPSLSRDNILHAIAFEMGLDVAATASRLEVMKTLQDYLLERHAAGRQVVVFVEEAQGMPLETLEEIRLLSNLETRQHKLLQIVLFGQPELDEALGAPHVRQIRERITQSFHLPPLRGGEIRDYLMFRLHLAGYRGADIFTAAAVRLIAFASRGLMRRINILADKAMLAAYVRQSRRVGARHVWAALRESEFAADRRLGRPVAWATPLAAGVLLAVGWGAAALWHDPEARVNLVAPAEAAMIADTRQPVAEVRTPEPVLSAPVVSGLEEHIRAGSVWLSQADASHFTIQIMLSPADDSRTVERFLNRPGVSELREQLHVYTGESHERAVIGVILGNYPSFQEAGQALQELPEALRRYKPFLRNVSQIQAESRLDRNVARADQ